MPHLIIEFTANVLLDQPRLLAECNAALLATGQFGEPDIKSRCIVLDSYRQGTVARRDGFVHATLSILSGRAPELRKSIAEAVRDAIVARVASMNRQLPLQVTVDVREIQRDTFAKSVLPG